MLTTYISTSMPLIPIPRGTRESIARGYFTKKGPRQFIHVHDHDSFRKHYPQFRTKNPTVRHKYVFEGEIMTASNILKILERREREQLLYNAMTRGTSSLRRSTRTRTPSIRLGSPPPVAKQRAQSKRKRTTSARRKITTSLKRTTRMAPRRSPAF